MAEVKSIKQVSCVHGACNIALEKVALHKGLPVKLFFRIIIVVTRTIVFLNSNKN